MKPFVASVFACSIIASSSASTLASGLSDDIRSQLDGYIASYEPRMREVAHQIWSRPELGYQEVNTANLLISELEKYGFQVEEGVAGIPTAFVAKAGSDHGPVIAILAEMDALPGFSQDALPFQQPVDGITSGHACGHHLFGTGSIAAAIALAQWMKDNNVEGKSGSTALRQRKAVRARFTWSERASSMTSTWFCTGIRATGIPPAKDGRWPMWPSRSGSGACRRMRPCLPNGAVRRSRPWKPSIT